jgi:hypothetical protein
MYREGVNPAFPLPVASLQVKESCIGITLSKEEEP